MSDVTAPKSAAKKAPVAAAKKAPVAAKKAPVQAATKAPAKPAKKAPVEAAEPVSRGPGKVHFKILALLASSKTKAFPGVSKPGELSYKLIAEEGQMPINNLTQYLAEESKSGTPYPNSLTSLGYTVANTYELTGENGESKNSPILYSITNAGREALKAHQKAAK